jgi:Holliday junction resolvase-like predicted endonuclease
MATARDIAASAEARVARELVRQGWTVLATNARHVGYELDIVATKRATLVVVEVKARTRRVMNPGELLPPRKRDALQRGAESMLARLGDQATGMTVRFDLAVVYARTVEYHVNVLG